MFTRVVLMERRRQQISGNFAVFAPLLPPLLFALFSCSGFTSSQSPSITWSRLFALATTSFDVSGTLIRIANAQIVRLAHTRTSPTRSSDGDRGECHHCTTSSSMQIQFHCTFFPPNTSYSYSSPSFMSIMSPRFWMLANNR